MTNENFSQKEILLQLMSEMREVRKEVGDQRILLEKHIETSNNRDKRIMDIENDLIAIKTELANNSGFRIRFMAVWGTVWSLFTLFAVYLLNRIF